MFFKITVHSSSNVGLSVLNELDTTGAVQKTMVKGLQPVAEIAQDGSIQYMHNDVLGSAVMITDASGAIVHQYEYEAFGRVASDMGSNSSETNYTYTDQEFDPESGLFYYNARYYNPRLGRFVSLDTVLGNDGDTLSRNLYIYVKNNPFRFTDPTGREAEGWGAQLWNATTGTVNAAWNGTKAAAGYVWNGTTYVVQYGGAATYEYVDANAWGVLPDINYSSDASRAGARAGNNAALLQGGFELVGGTGATGAGAGITTGSIIGGGGLCLETGGLGCAGGAVGAVSGEAITAAGAAVVGHGAGVMLNAKNKLDKLDNSGSGGSGGGAGGSGGSNKSIANEIANGHAYDKHVSTGEFGNSIQSREQFADRIGEIMDNPSEVKNLKNGRTAYWDSKTSTIVIHDPNAADAGTAFKPQNGKAYFNNIK